MTKRMTELVVHVADVEAECRFWEFGIGLKRIRPAEGQPYGRFTIFDIGGPRLEISQGPGLSAPANKDALQIGPVFLVDDVDSACAQAMEHGARELAPTYVMASTNPPAKIAWLLSPGGMAVSLVQGSEENYRKAMGQAPLLDYSA
jgi:hypothetical protein